MEKMTRFENNWEEYGSISNKMVLHILSFYDLCFEFTYDRKGRAYSVKLWFAYPSLLRSIGVSEEEWESFDFCVKYSGAPSKKEIAKKNRVQEKQFYGLLYGYFKNDPVREIHILYRTIGVRVACMGSTAVKSDVLKRMVRHQFPVVDDGNVTILLEPHKESFLGSSEDDPSTDSDLIESLEEMKENWRNSIEVFREHYDLALLRFLLISGFQFKDPKTPSSEVDNYKEWNECYTIIAPKNVWINIEAKLDGPNSIPSYRTFLDRLNEISHLKPYLLESYFELLLQEDNTKNNIDVQSESYDRMDRDLRKLELEVEESMRSLVSANMNALVLKVDLDDRERKCLKTAQQVKEGRKRWKWYTRLMWHDRFALAVVREKIACAQQVLWERYRMTQEEIMEEMKKIRRERRGVEEEEKKKKKKTNWKMMKKTEK